MGLVHRLVDGLTYTFGIEKLRLTDTIYKFDNVKLNIQLSFTNKLNKIQK